MTKYVSSLSEFMAAYEDLMISSNRWTEETGQRIKDFDRFCHKCERNGDYTLQNAVNEWFKKRDTEKINSCRSRIYPVIALLKYINAHGYTNIVIPEPPRKQNRTYIPHAFTEEEITHFFSMADNLTFNNANVLYSRSDKITVPVFFRFLYSTGLRTCEARWLKRSDVDLDHGVINVRETKCNIEHYVVMHDSLLNVLKRYDEEIEKFFTERTYFFPGRNGKCLTRGWVNHNFQRIWKKVSKEYANPYAFRHNYAITNINKWIDEKYEFFDKFVYLSKSMGHTSLESTKYYYSLIPGLADIIENTDDGQMDKMIPEVYKDDESK